MTTEVSISDLIIEATKDARWGDIDFLVEKCEAAGMFSDEDLDRAAKSYKKDRVRRLVKSLKDENGWPIFASVKVLEISGDEKRVYKQESLFDVDDYNQVVAYHTQQAQHHMQMANGYTERANVRFGNQLNLPYPE